MLYEMWLFRCLILGLSVLCISLPRCRVFGLETGQITSSVDPIRGTTCSFVATNLVGSFTPRYAVTALAWLRDGPMHSLAGQDAHTFIEIGFTVEKDSNNELLYELIFTELGEMLRTRRATLVLQKNVYSYIGPTETDVGIAKEGPGSSMKNWEVSNTTKLAIMQSATRSSRCEFITYSRLDADDILAPGFFQAMHEVIKNNYSGLGPYDKPWLGGFFSFREAVNWQLMLGGNGYKYGNRAGTWCRWRDEFHNGMSLAAGFSIGQTKALRTSVWEKIGFSAGGSHVLAMNDFREFVVHGYLNDTSWKAKTLTHLNKKARCGDKNKSRQRTEKHGNDPLLCVDEQISDQDYSRLWLMDVMNSGQFGLRPAGIYMLTPLSGHWPWYRTESASVRKFKHLCDSPVGLKEANSHFSSIPLDDYIKHSKAIFSDDKFNVMDACMSNTFWRNINSDLFLTPEETCEQLAGRLMVAIPDEAAAA